MKNIGAALVVIYLALIVFVVGGYVQNIFKLAACDFEAPYKAEVIHAAGLIPPVGAFVGWMDFGK